MRTEAVHGVHAVCDECRWTGPLRQRFGEAVTDERRHVHAGNASTTVTAFLHLAGHGSPFPARTAHLGQETTETHRHS